MSQEKQSGPKGRTRKAILAAAAELLAQGKHPTVADVADEAEVSRRTVYLYFPTLEQLLVDATLQTISRTTVDAALDAAEQDTDIEARVERMAREVQRMSATTEQQGRTLMRLTADSGTTGTSRPHPPRGVRRVEWIERAVAPVRSQLTPRQFEQLVSSLAMVIGWEALIVQRDVRGLSVSEAEDVSAWAARALVRAALDERAAGPSAVTPPIRDVRATKPGIGQRRKTR